MIVFLSDVTVRSEEWTAPEIRSSSNSYAVNWTTLRNSHPYQELTVEIGRKTGWRHEMAVVRLRADASQFVVVRGVQETNVGRQATCRPERHLPAGRR